MPCCSQDENEKGSSYTFRSHIHCLPSWLSLVINVHTVTNSQFVCFVKGDLDGRNVLQVVSGIASDSVHICYGDVIVQQDNAWDSPWEGRTGPGHPYILQDCSWDVSDGASCCWRNTRSLALHNGLSSVVRPYLFWKNKGRKESMTNITSPYLPPKVSHPRHRLHTS